MELRRLQYFVTVAHELNFRRSAEVLAMSQPALSQQIKVFERECGLLLFERSSAGVTLTAHGETLLVEAEQVLRQLDRLTQRAAELRCGRQQLRVVHTRSVVNGVPDLVVSQFRLARPDVDLRQDTAWTTRNVQMVRDGDADVAFVRLPLEPATDVDLVALGETEVVALLPRSHPLARRRALDVEDLATLPVVTWPREQAPGYYDHLVETLWGRGSPHVALVEPDPERIVRSVGEGVGVGVLDRERATRLKTPDVVVRRFRHQLSVGFGLLWATGNHSAAVNDFVAIARAVAGR